MKGVKQRNYNPTTFGISGIYRFQHPTNLRENAEVISHVARWADYYMNKYGWSNGTLSRKIGCHRWTLYALRSGRLTHCNITLLSALAVSLDCSLMDWLRSPAPVAGDGVGDGDESLTL